MRYRLGLAIVALLIGVGTTWKCTRAADDAAPKYTNKEVMKKAHKEGLLKKVTSGGGTKEEAAKLLELYTALAANAPPRGAVADWKSKTDVIVVAAQELADGKDGAGAKLQAAVNCAECHKVHKPE